MNKPKLPVFVRFQTLRARGIVENVVTLKRWQEELGFPVGRLLGPNVRAWTEDEIAEWLAARPTDRSRELAPKKRGRPRKQHTEGEVAA
jgi:hypothetical protein